MTAIEAVMDGMVGLPEAERYLGITRKTLTKMMDSGVIPTVAYGSHRRIPRRWLYEFAAGRVQGGGLDAG